VEPWLNLFVRCVILSLKVITKMQNTALNHVKEKHILNTQLKNVKSADKNINLYELQVSSVPLNVVPQTRKIG